MKKKGSALIITLGIIAISLMFSSLLMVRVFGAYRYTLINEKKEKLTLMAESGIDKGSALVKDTLYNLTSTTDLFDVTKGFKPSQTIQFTDGNFTASVKFFAKKGSYLLGDTTAERDDGGDKISGISVDDKISEAEGYYVKIIASAKNNITLETKVITAYILKKQIVELYNFIDPAQSKVEQISNFDFPFYKWEDD